MNPKTLQQQQGSSKKWMFTHSPEIKDFWPQETFSEVRVSPKIDETFYEDFEHRETCEQFWPATENQKTRESRAKRKAWRNRETMHWAEFNRRVTEYCREHNLIYKLK